jgi:DNA-binding SARP family transcriptional activator
MDLGSPQQKTVLALLLVRAGRRVSMAQFVDAVWGPRPPASAEQTVQTYIYRLRKLLSAGVAAPIIDRSTNGYLIRVSEEALDLEVFRRLVIDAEAARRAGQPERAAELLREALRLWTGPALADIRGDFAGAQRTALGRSRLNALEALLTHELDLGASSSALEQIAEAIAEHPLDERFRRLQMLALYRSGQQAEALAVYESTRALLAEELGIDPGLPLQALYQQILRSEPGSSAGGGQLAPAESSVEESPAAPLAPAQLPADPPGFVARAAELSQIDALVPRPDEQRRSAVAVIHGMAGTGKTTLAVHWAHRVAAQFPDGQVFVNLRGFDPSGSAMEPAEAIRGVLDALGVPSHRIPVGLASQAAFYRSVLAGRQILIVLDNARDAEQVRPLLPGSPGCLVVVTSRSHLTSLVALDHAYPLLLGELPRRAATDFLAERLGRARTDAESGELEGIVDLCGGLPLALAIIAARAILNPRNSLSTIITQLRTDRGTLNSFSDHDAVIDIRAIFSWSYQRLSTAAALLFRLMPLHPGPEIAVPAAASLMGLPVRETAALAGELTQAHLIIESSSGRFQIHELLRAYAIELHRLSDSEADTKAALRRLLSHYVHTARAAASVSQPLYSLTPVDVRAVAPSASRTTDAPPGRATALGSGKSILTQCGPPAKAASRRAVFPVRASAVPAPARVRTR